MAKKAEAAVAEKAEGKEKKEPRESKYEDLKVRWHKTVGDFDPVAALEALASASGYTVKITKSEKTGNVVFQVDTEESAKTSGRGRPKKLVSKETEQAAIKLLRAAMRDPEKAPRITELLAKSENGEDVSDELSELVGIGS